MAKRRERALRLLHTADWHLGHTLHDFTREAEHAAFLAWLRGVLAEEEIDALLIAGDVFDSSNPPTVAQELWYRFLGDCWRERPALDVVVIGGNHDSAQRLDAPNPLLGASRLRVIGGRGQRSAAELVVPIGPEEARAWVAAVPFLRPPDLPAGEGLVDGVRALYAEVVAAARTARGTARGPLLAMGHLYMVGGALSELSERKVLGGNQHALPVELFDPELAYVALGHLHKAQAVGGRESVRYSGSPLPLSTTEADYEHQVRLVELEPGGVRASRALRVPRHAEIRRIGGDGGVPLAAALAALGSLPDAGALPQDRWPFVEVRVALTQPEPTLVRQVQEALEGRAGRLVRVERVSAGVGGSLADAAPRRSLRELDPEEVFRLKWAREQPGEPGPELLQAFHEALDAALQQGGGA